MKKLILIILFFSFILHSQNKYSKVAIPFKNKNDFVKLAKLGIAIDHFSTNQNREIVLFLSENECNILKNNNIPFIYLIENWNDFYAKEQKSSKFIIENRTNSTPQNFHLGSMGGYYTLKEAFDELDSMRNKFPDLISKNDTIGFTLQGRPIIAVKISDNPNSNENEIQVLYDALHHAREPEGLTQLYYFMWHILENYSKSEETKFLIDNREMYFIPIVNPDGYFYNQRTNPNGGGMWRKNRFARGVNDTVGVDLNRNYGFKWGINEIGSSSSASSEVYRGPTPFSELETQAIKNFCDRKNFVLALNYHTYSNLLIYPWGFNDEDTNDSLFYRSASTELTTINRYAYGTGIQTVGYNTNGDSDDWMYGDTTKHKKIFSFTPEVGNGVDGFWPKKNRIIPLAEENLIANYRLAQIAGGLTKIKKTEFVKNYNSFNTIDTSIIYIWLDEIGKTKNNLENKITVKDFINDNHLKTIDSIAYLSPILSDDVFMIKVLHKNNESCLSHFDHLLPIKIESENCLILDTLKIFDGRKQIAFSENFDSTLSKNWKTTGTWGLTKINLSNNMVATESPNGNYTDNLNATLTLKNPILIYGDTKRVHLNFSAKWHIETNYDFLTVEASNDLGNNWNVLKGKYTSEAFGFSPQSPLFMHGYDAIKHDWINEEIDLSHLIKTFEATSLLIRFNFKSDSYENLDGFYLDDLSLLTWSDEIICNTKDETIVKKYSLNQNYPNPFNSSTQISFSIAKSENVKLKVYDSIGREVETLINKKLNSGEYKINFNTKNLNSGIYFYQIVSDNFNQTKKMLLLK